MSNKLKWSVLRKRHSMHGVTRHMSHKLRWRKANSVNNKLLDMQHRKLYSIINEFGKIQKEKSQANTSHDLLKKLLNYSKTHFNEEIKYMAEYNYPQLQNHFEEHRSYFEKIDNFIRRFENGEEKLNSKIILYLVEWWERHISVSDIKYAEYIKSQKQS